MAQGPQNSTPLQINYLSRDFSSFRQDLINYAQTRHSDLFAYLNDASPDVFYIELLSYLGDTLSYSTDKAFNEAYRESAQNKESLIRGANDLGFYNYFPKPSTTQATISITIPGVPTSDGSAMMPDPNYLIAISSGLQVQSSNGVIFECLDEINFSDTNLRTIIPNLDSNNRLINFTIQKTITLIAGETKIQRFYVSSSTAQPFMQIVINEDEVTQVLGVVSVPGNTYDIPTDDTFRDINQVYVQVENLAQNQIFSPITTDSLSQDLQNIINAYTDMTVNYGDWVNIPKRFIVRKDVNNVTTLIFGSTLVDFSYWNQLVQTYDIATLANFSLNQILNNMALGEIPPTDSTLFIKYRTGAGVKTNNNGNQTFTVINKNFVTPPSSANLGVLENVRNSLTIVSTIPAIGGQDFLSNDELRQLTGKVFAANDRAVTYEDVKSLVAKMPSQFGQPFRISFEEIKPRVLNLTQIQNYLTTQFGVLSGLQTTIDRELLIAQIQSFIGGLSTSDVVIQTDGTVLNYAQTSDAILNNTPSLWVGEKCRLYVLGIDQDYTPLTIYKDSNGILKSPNTLLKLNIANYLKTKRIIGDWIDIVDANVVNFQVNFTIIADKNNKQKVLIDCLTALRNYFNVFNWQINQPIFVSNVSAILQEINGVVNIVDLSFYNIFDFDVQTGKQYSIKEIGRYRNNSSVPLNTTGNKFQMNTVNNIITSYPDTLLHLKYPDLDIIGRVL